MPSHLCPLELVASQSRKSPSGALTIFSRLIDGPIRDTSFQRSLGNRLIGDVSFFP